MITLFGNKVHYGIPIFLHEVQHFLVGHIPCARTSNASNCDAGLGILNPGTTVDNAGTISWNSRNDSVLSMFVDDRQNIMIEAEEEENGNYKCRHKPLFPKPSRQESFVSVTGPNTGFNTPLPKYPFSNLEDLDNYINPTYSCTKKTGLGKVKFISDCRPEDYLFRADNWPNKSCNEQLNPENREINGANFRACLEAKADNQQYINTLPCKEPTIENLDNYCDDNLDNFENVYDLENSSHMRIYSQAAADNCVKKFCQREDVKEQLYGGRGRRVLPIYEISSFF